jgi:predicted ATPase
MKFGIRNFRCFANVPPIDIRPITILVGENSTGKTSFLAGFRFINELFQRGTNPSFNKDPYSLGSFKEIAHFRGGRAGRAGELSFFLKVSVRAARFMRTRAATDDEERSREVDIELTLSEVDVQPIASLVKITSGGYSVSIRFHERAEISYKTPNMRTARALSDEIRLPSSYNAANLNAVSFLVRDFRYIVSSRVVRRQELTETVDERELYLLEGIIQALVTSFPESIFAGAPVRTKPARTYDNIEAAPSPEGSHIPYLLARLKAFRSNDWQQLRDRLIEFGDASGLFQNIDVKRFVAAPGSPFQISVNVGGPASNLVDVGYGVSQSLPVVVETLQAPRGSLFLLQQPEVHLHPRAQAALGTYLANVSKQRRHTILIETHSDHLLDRIRMDVRDKKGIRAEDVSILFFHRDGLDVKVHQLTFDEQGNIIDAPVGYRQFFLEEQLRSIDPDVHNN